MNFLSRCLPSGLLVALSVIVAGQPTTLASEQHRSPDTQGIETDQAIDFSTQFQDLAVEGAILIYDLQGDRT